ncbi:MAG: hypothetical protein IKE53_07730 [Clostridiales bacterium]|nr:hypothetical protein [Clostridiales bacterium]
MKSRSNDDFLDSAFQEEYSKIPPFLRINKISLIISISLASAVMIALGIYIHLLQTNDREGIIGGVENMVEGFNGVFLAVVPLGILAIWFIICIMLEKSAFRKASALALKHSQWEEKKLADEVRRFRNDYVEPERSVSEPGYCPKCGLLLMDGEKICSLCRMESSDSGQG